MMLTIGNFSMRHLVVLAALASAASPAPAQLIQDGTQPPRAEGWRAETVVEGLPRPWGMAWLADGRMLVTGEEGSLHLVEGKQARRIPIDGLPDLYTGGQGGLLDISIHPQDKGPNPRVYMTYATGSADSNHTALMRGIFDGQRVRDVKTLFEAQPTKVGGEHFGSRILWLPDGTMLMSVGDGGNPPRQVGNMLAREQAQNLGSHNGSVLRLTDEGRPAPDNPFVDTRGALPAIWAYGLRNVQGLARDPASGRIFASDHGPRGGDEINVLEKGANYGWPLQSYGLDYRTREPIGQKTVPGMKGPIVVWSPSPAPSGLAYYTGKAFPDWRGSLFSGSLAGTDIRRIVLDGNGRSGSNWATACATSGRGRTATCTC